MREGWDDIAKQNRDGWAGENVLAITEVDGWRTVHQHTKSGSVSPQVSYATPHEALARLIQLAGIEAPIAPQNWPEQACIGSVRIDPTKDD